MYKYVSNSSNSLTIPAVFSLVFKYLNSSSPGSKVQSAEIVGATVKPSYDPSLNPKIIASITQQRVVSATGLFFLEALMGFNLPGDQAGGTTACWEQGATPLPIVLHLHQSGTLPKGRALIPGCGSGYDVAGIAELDRFVVGLDISENAIKRAREPLPTAGCFTFQRADFFKWEPEEQSDLIFDYTFFAAIDPSLRPQWGDQVPDLLKPDGELITFISPISDHVGGPPYGVSIADYEKVLIPLGFEAISIEDNQHSVETRKGMKKLERWKRSANKSS